MSVPLRWKLIGGFLLVFIAGGIAGAFVGAMQSRHHRFAAAQNGSLVETVRKRMQSRLDLTPEQMVRARPVLDHAAHQLEQIRDGTGRSVREIFDQTDQQLAPELTAAQRKKMEQLEAQRRAAADKNKRD